jgi:hypothetical protein
MGRGGAGEDGGASAAFEEAEDGAGLETRETTIACGRFGDGLLAQVTPGGVHLCAVALSAAAAAAASGVSGRGLHSFTLELNLSNSRTPS